MDTSSGRSITINNHEQPVSNLDLMNDLQSSSSHLQTPPISEDQVQSPDPVNEQDNSAENIPYPPFMFPSLTTAPSSPTLTAGGTPQARDSRQETSNPSNLPQKQAARETSTILESSPKAQTPIIKLSLNEIPALPIPDGIHLPQAAEGITSSDCIAALYHLIDLHAQAAKHEINLLAESEKVASQERESYIKRIHDLEVENQELHLLEASDTTRIHELEAQTTALQSLQESHTARIQELEAENNAIHHLHENHATRVEELEAENTELRDLQESYTRRIAVLEGENEKWPRQFATASVQIQGLMELMNQASASLVRRGC
ncbi:hypothetical protein BJX70DRAFT_357421 [Aspergillus crustosus]